MDECTFSPDRIIGKTCCSQHDVDYTLQKPKLESDLKFAKCVTKNKNIVIGVVVMLSVTTFGWFWYIKAGIKYRKFK